jgi:hypothetical protein
MCPQAAMAAVSIASSVVSFMGASEDYENKAAQWRQNAANSLASGVEDQKKILLRMTQEQDAFVQKRHLTNVDGAEAKAQAEVSAAEGGVSGLSLDNILGGIDRDISRNQTADRTNYENTVVQLGSELEATNTQIENRINSMQKPTKPNPLGYALQGVGGALKAFA